MGFDVEKAITELGEIRAMVLGLVRATPEERVDWRPASDTGDPTTISEQLKHCLGVEYHFVEGLIGGKTPDHGEEGGDFFASSSWAKAGPAGALSTKADLMRCLEESTEHTATALRNVPVSGWDEVVDAGFTKRSKAAFVELLVHHWWWHAGQIAYVQRLYGDTSVGN